jgi:pimeloyl-ACP methyl ester carboxylesterase
MPNRLQLSEERVLAYHHEPGSHPTVVFCGGFASDMTGTKATLLDHHCRARGRAFTRFDYTGHGQSSGRFEDGTIGSWAADALAIVDRVAEGPLVLVGSSMGGWIMLLVALARPERVAGLVGIASAPDFTADLIEPALTAEQQAALADDGGFMLPSEYDEAPTPITRRLLEDGRQHLLLRAPIAIDRPVHLIHGQRDPDVPWPTSLRLAERLAAEDVTIELIKDGDHRLSRPQDLARITHAVDRIVASVG